MNQVLDILPRNIVFIKQSIIKIRLRALTIILYSYLIHIIFVYPIKHEYHFVLHILSNCYGKKITLVFSILFIAGIENNLKICTNGVIFFIWWIILYAKYICQFINVMHLWGSLRKGYTIKDNNVKMCNDTMILRFHKICIGSTYK